MKYRTYNEKNIDSYHNHIFATYFRTKKEAQEYAKEIGGNAVVERKIAGQWFPC